MSSKGPFDAGNRLIAAIDVASRHRAEHLVETIGDAADFIKIGLELFVAEGPVLVRYFAGRRRRIMLDLKLHDIPATVERAVRSVSGLGAELVTVHASGGPVMLEAAATAARQASIPLRVLAVTVLTSMDRTDLRSVGVDGSVDDVVVQRALMAVDAGCAGVVASPREAAALRAAVPSDFLIVTPGVRPAGSAVLDQKRVMTPAEARAGGADMVVVGRPIRDAADPRAAAMAIAAELRR